MTATIFKPIDSYFPKRKTQFDRDYNDYIFRTIELANTITPENAHLYEEEWEYLRDLGWAPASVYFDDLIATTENNPESIPGFSIGDRVAQYEFEPDGVWFHMVGTVQARVQDCEGDWIYCIVPVTPEGRKVNPRLGYNSPEWLYENEIERFDQSLLGRINAEFKKRLAAVAAEFCRFESQFPSA